MHGTAQNRVRRVLAARSGIMQRCSILDHCELAGLRANPTLSTIKLPTKNSTALAAKS